MPVYLSPGVYVEELYAPTHRPDRTWSNDDHERTDDIPTIEMVGPGAAALIGFTERMPVGRDGAPLRRKPLRISGWEQFVEQFGGFVEGAALPHAVHGFFANGGTQCHVVSLRTVGSDAGLESPANQLADFDGTGTERTGLAALESIEDVTLLCAPDLMTSHERGALDLTWVLACQHSMIAFSEKQRYCTAILDTPPDLTPEAAHEWRTTRARFESAHTVLYYPWIYAGDDPDSRRTIPPCGHVAGAYVRSYVTRGPHQAPANEILQSARDVDVRVTREEQSLLNPIGINVLRGFPDGSIRMWGAHTLASEPAHRSIQVRVLLNAIERSIQEGTAWAIFQKYDAALRRRICCALHDFLARLWRSGALAGDTEADAFYVKDDTDGTSGNQPAVEIGVAIHQSGEFRAMRVVFVSDQIVPGDDEADGAELAPRQAVTTSPRIFLSYGREDWNEFVAPLVQTLRDAGFSVWVDQHLLRGGHDWMDKINEALEGCQVMVLCVSPDAMASKHVKLEYRYFFNDDKAIVPVVCRPASLPAELRGIQYLSYAEHDALIERLKELLPS